MSATEKPHFFILYSARHKRCGEFLERADYRVASKDELLKWSQRMLPENRPNILSLHCDKCSEDIAPTHLRIIADTDISVQLVVPEMEIKKFNPKDWILPKNY